MVTRGLACALIAAALGCQGGSEPAGRVERARGDAANNPEALGSASSGSAKAAAEKSAEKSDRASPDKGPPDRGLKDVAPKPDEPEAPDPGKVLDALGAIPAWQAVVDRADYLARRKQHGVVYGRIGDVVVFGAPAEGGFGDNPSAVGGGSGAVAVGSGAGRGSGNAVAASGSGTGTGSRGTPSPYRWLVDDSEGNGSLGIRVALGDHAVKQGDRVALGGAWELDPDRHWYWNVDRVQPVPAAAPSDVKDPPPARVGHAIASGDLPPGARTISLARDNDAVYFQIVAPYPTDDADGWTVADQLGNPPFAVLSLPGERASYGGQDMRSPDEHWALKRGVTYWVRIGKLHKHGPDKPTTINARTAPVRVL